MRRRRGSSRRLIALAIFVLSIVGVIVLMNLGLPESVNMSAVGVFGVLFVGSAIWFAVESFLGGNF